MTRIRWCKVIPMESPKGPKTQNNVIVQNSMTMRRPDERPRSPRTRRNSSDNLKFQASSQRLLVAKGDPQLTLHVMIATLLIIYIAFRSRPGPADGDHGQSDDEEGGLNGSSLYFLFSSSRHPCFAMLPYGRGYSSRPVKKLSLIRIVTMM